MEKKEFMEKSSCELDVKKRILDVARELFIRKGYSGTSVRDIANAADANVAHVKYYFGSKYNLFEVIFNEVYDLLVKRVSETLNSNLSFFEMVESWINLYYELLAQYPQMPVFLLNEVNQGHQSLIAKIISSKPDKAFYHLSERVAQEVERGTIKDVPVVSLGLNVLSMCVFPFMFKGLAIKVTNQTDSEFDKLLSEHKKYVVDFVFSGLKP